MKLSIPVPMSSFSFVLLLYFRYFPQSIWNSNLSTHYWVLCFLLWVSQFKISFHLKDFTIDSYRFLAHNLSPVFPTHHFSTRVPAKTHSALCYQVKACLFFSSELTVTIATTSVLHCLFVIDHLLSSFSYQTLQISFEVGFSDLLCLHFYPQTLVSAMRVDSSTIPIAVS